MSATLTEVTVSVTQEHIDRGKRNDCSDCPVALAFLDALPGARIASVRYWDHDGDLARAPEIHVTVDFDAGFRYYRAPDEVAAFVADFDDGLAVSPFTFTAEVP